MQAFRNQKQAFAHYGAELFSINAGFSQDFGVLFAGFFFFSAGFICTLTGLFKNLQDISETCKLLYKSFSSPLTFSNFYALKDMKGLSAGGLEMVLI